MCNCLNLQIWIPLTMLTNNWTFVIHVDVSLIVVTIMGMIIIQNGKFLYLSRQHQYRRSCKIFDFFRQTSLNVKCSFIGEMRACITKNERQITLIQAILSKIKWRNYVTNKTTWINSVSKLFDGVGWYIKRKYCEATRRN